MEQYTVSKIFPDDTKANREMDLLLAESGLRRDANLDYSCGIYDNTNTLIATGSSFVNTLRCLAVSEQHKGDGLMNIIIGHLIDKQRLHNFFHTFLYTKYLSGKFFRGLGFYDIVNINNELSFMENKPNGFKSYLSSLAQHAVIGKRIGAIVLNANPFTSGHLALIEHASVNCDYVHVFIVSEDSSLFPYAIRKKLITEGTAHLKNIIFHDTGSYIISNATFPAYFQKDNDTAIYEQALLDISIFSYISAALGITCRFAGEEPYSIVTGVYNDVMKTQLPATGIAFNIIPRKTYHQEPISASRVRTLIKNDNIKEIEALVPQTTYAWLMSKEAEPVINKIKTCCDVIHY